MEIIKHKDKHYLKSDTGYREVLASTDTSLTESIEMIGTGTTYIFKSPKPSQEWIEHYISEYNKGNVITDVQVEYDRVCDCVVLADCYNPELLVCDKKYKIKVDNNNTITIKSSKESWNREEHIKEIIDFATFYSGMERSKVERQVDKWIKENLL